MTKPVRAAVYARVSTTGHGQDVGLQLDELRAVAKQRGLHLVAEFVDEGVSGATTSRPGFDAMMKAAQAGKFEHLLVWKLDRLGRSTAHLVGSLDLLAGWGVSFCSVRDPGVDTTSAHGRLLLQLLAVPSRRVHPSGVSRSLPLRAADHGMRVRTSVVTWATPWDRCWARRLGRDRCGRSGR